MAFDPNAARPLEFDPSTAKSSEFDPNTAQEVKASWSDTFKAIPSQVIAGSEQAVGGIARAVGESSIDFQPAMLANPVTAGIEVARNLPGMARKAFPGAFDKASEFGTTMYDIGKARMESDTPEDQTFWQKAVSTAAQSAGQAVPLTAAALLTKNPGIVAGGFGAQEFGRAYGQARDEGLPEDKAFRYAAINGMVEAGTEYLPMKSLFKQDQGFAKRFVNFMAKELPGENIAELTQMVNEWANGLKEDITWQDVKDTILLTSAATLLTGGVQSGVAHLATGGKREEPTAQPTASQEQPAVPEGPTLEDIAQADGADLDAMVEEFLAAPDVEAFNEEVAASESAKTDENIPQNIPVQSEQMLDRRETARGPDRRVDDLLRKDWDTLTDDEKREVYQEQKRLINTDPMTGVKSQGAYLQDAPKAKGATQMDLTLFKGYNTMLGEDGGDVVLKVFGQVMEEVSPGKGYRKGGDEFTFLHDNPESASQDLERIREAAANVRFSLLDKDGNPVTVEGIPFSGGAGKDAATALKARDATKGEYDRNALPPNIKRVGQARPKQGSVSDRGGDTQRQTAGRDAASSNGDQGLNEHLQEQAQTSEEVTSAGTDVPRGTFDPSTAQPEPVAKTAQTETPEFKKWFGESKVVDESGEPLVVYHGTDNDFTVFDEGKLGAKGAKPASIGFWFSDDQDYSKVHGDKVMPAYLSMRRPYVVKSADELQKLGADKARVESLKKQGYDGVMVPASEEKLGKQTVRNAAIYAVFNPSQIKSTDNRGTFDESDPNILHANPISAVYKGYQRLANAALTRVHDAWGWKMTPLGKLPAQDLYLKERYETLGKIADVESISKRVYETFKGLDAREAELVYEYFTTKDADDTKLSDKPVKYEWKGEKTESTVRKQAITIKRLINRVGQNLVERGLLSKESHEKYEDAYLPRVYMKHLLGDGRSFAGGKKPSDMGYLKERKDIPKEVRELILGEITDPGYLASKSLGKSMRDLAILDWFDEISQNKDWAMPEFLVDYKGKKASIYWLKAESARIKEQIPYYKPDNQKKAQDIVKQMDAIVQAGEAKLGKVTDAYRQVPDTSQYGRLRGMYIRKEIFNDITGIPGQRDPNAQWWQAPFEYGGIGTKATQLWKMSKVALNPPTQIRNFISNGILLQLSGVGSHRVLPLMVQAIQDIRQNGKYYRIAKKYGITGSTFANNELYKIEREFLDLKAKNAGKLSMAQMKAAGAKIGEMAGDAYQMSEAIWKTAKIIDAMKREGKDEVAAVLDAQKWLYDYSLVPQSVRYFRNTPIGIPFLTFYYKTLPRMLEVAATAPHRFAPYVAIPALFTAWIASSYDVEPEDVEKLKKALPEWLRDHGHLFFLPYKDQHGRWQAYDFSYLLPWSMFEQTMNNLKEGQVGEAVSTAGVFNGPVTGIIAPIVTGGIDPFTKKPIVDKSDPPADQIASIMNYLWSLGAPTWLTENGAIKKMYDAIMGNVNPKTGEPQLTVPQAALRLGGLNMYPIEPEESRRKNIQFMGFEIEEIQKRMGERLKDKTLDTEDKRKIREVYQELIREKKEQLKDYREASKIHPNLKGGPVKEKAAGDYEA